MIKFICHLSTEDLVLFDKENRLEDGRPNCFVANKFDVEVDPSAIICNARRVLAQEYMNEITWNDMFIRYIYSIINSFRNYIVHRFAVEIKNVEVEWSQDQLLHQKHVMFQYQHQNIDTWHFPTKTWIWHTEFQLRKTIPE